MDKSRQRKKLVIHAFCHALREIITFIISLIFWLYFMIACILVIGSLFTFNIDIVLIIRMLLNVEAVTMSDIFFTLLKFIIIDIIIFSLCLISRKIIYKKEGINHGKVF